jgi:hypothetical protein
MTDVHFNALLLGLVLSLYLLLKARGGRGILGAGVLAGLLTGLLCSVKVTGMLLGGGMFLGILLVRRLTVGIGGRQARRCMLAFAATSLIAVYGLNPYFWPSLREFDAGAAVTELKTLHRDIRSGELPSEGRRELYPQLANLSHVLEFPRLFLVWRAYTERQESIRPGMWEGNRLLTLHRRLLGTYSTFVLEWAFLGIGLAVGFSRLLRSLRSKIVDPVVLPIWYFAVLYLFLLLFVNLNWPRYYLPTTIAIQLLAGLGIVSTLAFAQRKLRVLWGIIRAS